MKCSFFCRAIICLMVSTLMITPADARGLGGAGGRGGGGFHGGGGGGGRMPSGAGMSGGGYRPSPSTRQARPQFSGGQRPAVSKPGGGVNVPNQVHRPNTGGGSRPQTGSSRPQTGAARPQVGSAGGQNSRPGLQPGSRPQLGSGTQSQARPAPSTRPGSGGERPGLAERPNTGGRPGTQESRPTRPGDLGNTTRPQPGNRLPGEGSRPGAGSATLPGLGTNQAERPSTRPGIGNRPTGEAGNRLPGGLGSTTRPENAVSPARPIPAPNSPDRFNPNQQGSIPDRHQELAGRFDTMSQNGGEPGWNSQHWEGPNGGDVNHVGYWGPNGYWGHTGVWGPEGGHWGHSTAVGPNGVAGRTTAWGPNGYGWSHGGAIGKEGAFGYARTYGPAGYWSNNWGGWYNDYAPAWGHGRWDYLWDEYPVATAFGVTMWGVNAVSWAYGISDYTNPYYASATYITEDSSVVSYAEPILGDPEYVEESVTVEAEGTESTDPVVTAFDAAREAFYQADFAKALQLTDEALQQAPRDAALNEFRSLCLFALGKYTDAAAVVHAVLAAGPGWDWTTLISLYENGDTYTQQLRQLEAAVKQDPAKPELRFLLGYHYMTAGHKDKALQQFEAVVQLQPNDKLSANLVKMFQPSKPADESQANTPAADLEESAYPMDKLYGDWTAKDSEGAFTLHLGDNDEFVWKFTRGDQPQTVSGAYVVRGDNLVMQPDSGGVMLSTIELKGDKTLEFKPLDNSNSLTFTR